MNYSVLKCGLILFLIVFSCSKADLKTSEGLNVTNENEYYFTKYN